MLVNSRRRYLGNLNHESRSRTCGKVNCTNGRSTNAQLLNRICSHSLPLAQRRCTVYVGMSSVCASANRRTPPPSRSLAHQMFPNSQREKEKQTWQVGTMPVHLILYCHVQGLTFYFLDAKILENLVGKLRWPTSERTSELGLGWELGWGSKIKMLVGQARTMYVVWFRPGQRED